MTLPEPVVFWLDTARRDQGKARRLADPPMFSEGACFCAQQAAEKALKAYLCWLGIPRIPRTHDLNALAGLIPEGASDPFDRAALDGLSAYAVTARYERPLPSDQEAEQALAWADAVLTQVEGLLEPADE